MNLTISSNNNISMAIVVISRLYTISYMGHLVRLTCICMCIRDVYFYGFDCELISMSYIAVLLNLQHLLNNIFHV